MSPQSQDVRRSVEKVIQSSLKETLGAQFTEKDGENVIKRTWNPQAPIEYNAAAGQKKWIPSLPSFKL